MIFDLDIYNQILLSIPVLILIIFWSLKFDLFRYDLGDNIIVVVLMIVIPIIAVIFNYYLIKSNNWLGYFYYAIIIIPLILLILNEKYVFLDGPEINGVIVLKAFVSFIPTILLIFLLIQNIGNDFNQTITTKNELKLIDIKTIEVSFNKIKEKYSSIERTVKEESKNIDDMVSKALVSINQTNKELEDLRKREIKLKNEIEYLKGLASISEEQSKVIVETLSKNKYLDYLVGGLLGFIASLAVAFIANPKLIERFIGKTSANKT